MSEPVRIGNRLVGPGEPAVICAEIGINHNGSLDLAKQMIRSAVMAGVDAVKFQNYRTEDFITDKLLTYSYLENGIQKTVSQVEMFKQYELAPEAFLALRTVCEKEGVLFLSTPTGESGVQDLIKIRAHAIKNGSDFLTNTKLLRFMGNSKLPIIVSVGMSTVSEVSAALDVLYETGNRQIVLLHCISTYPAAPEEVNLRKIETLKALFDCPVGFSDHTIGNIAALGAVALGACFIEKHFTLDRSSRGPDHSFSSDPDEFAQLVRSIRNLEKCMGEIHFGPARSEYTSRALYRLSCVAAKDLPAGHVLTSGDITFSRPGTGAPPVLEEIFYGRKLMYKCTRGSVLSFDMFRS